MHFVAGQRVDDVGHALAGVRRVFGVRKALGEFHEGFVGLLGGFLVALGEVLVDQRREQPQVVVEVDQALEVERVVHGRAGGVQADETVQRGNRLRLLVGFVLGVGLVNLGLLGQHGTSSAAFELFVQANRFVPGACRTFVAGFLVDLFGRPAHRDVFGGAGTG